MRVVVATDRYPALTSAQAGATIATAWAELGAQVAVVPLGNATEGFQQATADLLAAGVDMVSTDHGLASVVEAMTDGGLVVAIRPDLPLYSGSGIDVEASTHSLGQLVADLVVAARQRGRVQRIILELADLTSHDGGAGLLEALGATSHTPLRGGVAELAGIQQIDLEPVLGWLDGATLDLVVPADEAPKHLVGLKGITSVRGHAAQLDPAFLLATDQSLVDLGSAIAAALNRPTVATAPGAGAAGGVGQVVLALGGTVTTGARLGATLAGLERTIAQADLVVTGGGRLDFGTMGGDVLSTMIESATQALRPLVVIAQQNFISTRELRSIGVEAAYSVRPETEPAQADAPEVDAEELLRAARPVASSWHW